jgi:hypothetical protein
MSDEDVVELLNIAKGHLPRARLEYDRVKAEFNCGCRGNTEFRPEFEAFLCDNHHKWAVRKSWKDEYSVFDK